MDRGAWQDAVHGVAKSRTRLSDEHFHSQYIMITIYIMVTVSCLY